MNHNDNNDNAAEEESNHNDNNDNAAEEELNHNDNNDNAAEEELNHNDDNENAAEEVLSPFDIVCRKIRDNDPTTISIELTEWAAVELRDDAKTHQLCDALANNTHLRHLALDVRRMSVQGTAEFVETVVRSNLVSINLNGGEEVAVEIKHALFRMLACETLKLEKVRIGMALGEEDVILLYECLKERRLSKFELAQPTFPPSLSIAAVKDLSKIVAKSTQVVFAGYMNPDIQRVIFKDGIQASEYDFQSLKIQSGSIEDLDGLVASLYKLSELRLAHCIDFQGGFDLFCTRLSRVTHHLSLLEISLCGLDDHKMKILAQALSHNRSIKTLDLGSNKFGDAGVAALIEHWNESSPLKNLLLSGNCRISYNGVQLLLSAVAGNDNKKSLDRLKISYNLGGFGYGGLQALAQEALPHARVRDLDLSGCGSPFFCEEFSIMIGKPDEIVARKIASQAVLEAVQRNTYLHQVTFADNELTRDVEQAVSFLLAANRRGRYLLTDEHHGLGGGNDAIWCHVFAKCRDDASVIYFFLRERPTLVMISSTPQPASANGDGHGKSANNKKRRGSTGVERATKRNSFGKSANSKKAPWKQQRGTSG